MCGEEQAMLLSGRLPRPDNNACQGKPLDLRRISSIQRFARVSEIPRPLLKRGTVPFGLNYRLSPFTYLTRLRLVFGPSFTSPRPRSLCASLTSRCLILEFSYATPYT